MLYPFLFQFRKIVQGLAKPKKVVSKQWETLMFRLKKKY